MTKLEKLSHYMAYDLKMFGPEDYHMWTIANKPARRIETLTLGSFYALEKLGYRPLLKSKDDMPSLNLSRPHNLKLIFEHHYDYFNMIEDGEALETY